MQDRFSFSGHIFSSMDEDYTPPPSTPTSAPVNPTSSTPSSFTPSNPGASAPSPSAVTTKPKVHNGLASYKEGYTYEEQQIFDKVLRETMDIYDIDTLNRCLALMKQNRTLFLYPLQTNSIRW